MGNTLYYGDNLDVLRRHVADESVDLVYLDPPFKSDQNYNVLFQEQDGSRSASQIRAFEDTWQRDQSAAAFKELHRVLKPTGSIYLHCDPTASHYLKVLMDGVFGPAQFRNEVTWQRTNVHNDAKRWGKIADILLYYGKTDTVTWNTPRIPHSVEHIRFCGCGTAIAVAQRLNRKWIGIDITYLAISLMKHRLHTAYGDSIKDSYQVIGEPVSVTDATALAAEDPYQFQWWSLGLVNARPVEQKKGADRGVDGRLFFHDEAESGKTKQVIISVKAGNTGPAHVRDLRGVVEREKAAIGLLITMEDPTAPMRKEAASAEFYECVAWNTKHPKLQILTVGELLEGKMLDAPPSRDIRTFKKAPRAIRKPTADQKEIF